MKTIKKVAVTPVTPNTGDIIDSFSTTDDKHTNAPSINAVEQALANKQSKAYYGTNVPSSILGQDGDIYFQYSL